MSLEKKGWGRGDGCPGMALLPELHKNKSKQGWGHEARDVLPCLHLACQARMRCMEREEKEQICGPPGGV